VDPLASLRISALWQRTNDVRAEYPGCVERALRCPRDCMIEEGGRFATEIPDRHSVAVELDRGTIGCTERSPHLGWLAPAPGGASPERLKATTVALNAARQSLDKLANEISKLDAQSGDVPRRRAGR
jgi:hypothetical protein